MMAQYLLFWHESDDVWPSDDPRMEWHCRCGKEVSVVWTSHCSLYDTDEAIEAKDANTDWWKLECHNGHVLLLARELADDETADTCPAPTTREIVQLLGSPEDVSKWLISLEPVPKPDPVVQSEAPRVVDLMEALEASLAAVKNQRPSA